MKVPTEQELMRLETEAELAEDKLQEEIGEAEADVAEVVSALAEMKEMLDLEAAYGNPQVTAMVSTLKALKTPSLPLAAHLSRTMEARADALRARMWLVSAMRDDLKRLATELGQSARIIDEGRRLVRKAVELREDARRAEEAREEERRAEELRAEQRRAEELRAEQRRAEELRAEQRRAEELRAEQRIGDAQPAMSRFDRIRAKVDESPSVVNGIHESQAPRRQAPRLRLDAAIDLHSQSNFYTGFTENISKGGIFMATRQKIPLGTDVDLAFTLPTGVEIRGRGKVRWSREETAHTTGGVGVQFDHLSEEAMEAIGEFLEAREPIFHPDDDD